MAAGAFGLDYYYYLMTGGNMTSELLAMEQGS